MPAYRTKADKPLASCLILRTAGFAAEALGRIGDKRAVEPLIGALRSGDEILSTDAAEALGRIGDRRAIGPLIDSLERGAASGRRAAADALSAIGDERAVQPLIALLDDTSASVRRSAAVALGRMGNPRAEVPLVRHLDDRDERVREAVAAALQKLGWTPDRTAAGAAYLISRRDWDGCVEIGPDAVQPLIAALQDEVVGVRQKAAWALGRIGDTRATWALAAALRDRDADVRRSAGWALEALGPPALEPLVDAFLDEDADVSAVAAQVLERIGWKLDTRDLRTPSRREQAKWDICARIGTEAVVPVAAALRDRAWPARARAAKTLGKIGDARALEPLITALKDTDFHVRKAAAEALETLGWQAGRTGDGARHLIAKGEWAQCIEIGAPAVEPLLAALGYETGHSRARAAHALVEIYQSGTLTDTQKRRILGQRQRIRGSQTHTDERGHQDVGEPSCHQDFDSSHRDTGIRVDFPL